MQRQYPEYDALMADSSPERKFGERSADDLYIVYTGGTTGMPKGVMWRAGDLWRALGGGSNAPANRGQAPESIEAHVKNVLAAGPIARQIIACPLMHGTGLLTAIGTISSGGCIITLEGAAAKDYVNAANAAVWKKFGSLVGAETAAKFKAAFVK